MMNLKKAAAEKAVEFIESGMVVGLGTGSTAAFAVEKIGELIKAGKLNNIKGIPSSVQTEMLAKQAGIPLTNFDKDPVIDLTIDGADEVDENLNLIKGGGGALLREKVLAQASKINIIIVDESKISKRLGEKWAAPIEVIRFASAVEERFLQSLGAKTELRADEKCRIVVTDENNWIIDANFGALENPDELARSLENRAGIVEHGLFIGLAHKVIVASESGIKILEK
ncbi:MAG: ribose 5-phosphate isomerase A [Chlorobi bacterium]|nr:ribose 5-phosphate isomerase A [Chlorobiota bacterium]